MRVSQVAIFTFVVTAAMMSASARAVDYTAPYFTEAQSTGGIFTDGLGGQWQAITISDFGGTFASKARAMKWDGASQWTHTDSAGTINAPANGAYQSGAVTGATLVHEAGTGGSAFPAINFIAPVDGVYSIDGTALITGERTRVNVQTYTGVSGTATVLVDQWNDNNVLVDAQFDLGAQASWQNLNLLAGDRISIHIYTVASSGSPGFEFELGGFTADPVKIVGPPVPEPATLALLGMATATLVVWRRPAAA